MDNQKNINKYSFSQPACSSDRPSFYDMLAAIKSELEYDNFTARTQPIAGDICMAITEVMMLDPSHEIKIDGEMIPVATVQEIYRHITSDHIQMVIDNFLNYKTQLHSKKLYFRTAVYNSAFELDSHYVNQAKADLCR